MNNIITYSPSTTIPLTHACANHCLYCGFREDGDGLLSFREIETLASRAIKEKTPEALLISGENADQTPSVQDTLKLLGMSSMVQWTKKVCDYLLGLGLLPHINIGLLDFADLRELKEVSASMGLMMEGDYGELGSRIQPQKNFQERMQNLEWAGKLQIPFTTGILTGLGESQRDRIRSIQAILACAKTYGHVQEIILQNYALNLISTVPARGVPCGELKELITLCKDEAPEMPIQIPPNLYPDLPNLMALGINDLGGISQQDVVNSQNPWPPISGIAGILEKKKYTLKKRLPLYVGYYRRGWYSERVGAAIEKWIQAEDEYRYYAQ